MNPRILLLLAVTLVTIGHHASGQASYGNHIGGDRPLPIPTVRTQGARTEYSDWHYIRQTLRHPQRAITSPLPRGEGQGEGQTGNGDAVAKVDLTPVFTWHTNNNKGPNPMPDWRPIIGTASRINTNGLLVVLHPQFPIANLQTKTVWLKNHPGAPWLVDGDPIHVLAREAGRHQYLDVFRAVTTVPAFDHGIPIPTTTTNTNYIGAAK